jgi:hypothetical protein
MDPVSGNAVVRSLLLILAEPVLTEQWAEFRCDTATPIEDGEFRTNRFIRIVAVSPRDGGYGRSDARSGAHSDLPHEFSLLCLVSVTMLRPPRYVYST